MLRISESLRDRIAQAAEANMRSMNAEIVSRLEFTFADPDGPLTIPQKEELRKVVMESIQETLVNVPAYKEFLDARAASDE